MDEESDGYIKSRSGILFKQYQIVYYSSHLFILRAKLDDCGRNNLQTVLFANNRNLESFGYFVTFGSRLSHTN